MNLTYLSPEIEEIQSVPTMLCISPLVEDSSTDGYSYDETYEIFE